MTNSTNKEDTNELRDFYLHAMGIEQWELRMKLRNGYS